MYVDIRVNALKNYVRKHINELTALTSRGWGVGLWGEGKFSSYLLCVLVCLIFLQ